MFNKAKNDQKHMRVSCILGFGRPCQQKPCTRNDEHASNQSTIMNPNNYIEVRVSVPRLEVPALQARQGNNGGSILQASAINEHSNILKSTCNVRTAL
jgi:hypothetical protein